MNQDEQLRNIGKRRTKVQAETTVKLGEALQRLMSNRISPRHQRFQSVAQLWEQLLPAEIARHCKVVDIAGGELKVVTDSPTYSHELRWCSSGILKQIQRQCPGARIKKIKCVIGGFGRNNKVRER